MASGRPALYHADSPLHGPLLSLWANYLGAVGIRVRVRSMERAAFLAAWRG